MPAWGQGGLPCASSLKALITGRKRRWQPHTLIASPQAGGGSARSLAGNPTVAGGCRPCPRPHPAAGLKGPTEQRGDAHVTPSHYNDEKKPLLCQKIVFHRDFGWPRLSKSIPLPETALRNLVCQNKREIDRQGGRETDGRCEAPRLM